MIKLRKARIEDVDILHCILVEAFSPLYELFHDEMNPMFMTKKELYDRIVGRGKYFCITVDDEIIGGVHFAKVRKRVSAIKCHILYVASSLQGRGIGEDAMYQVISTYPKYCRFELTVPKGLDKNIRCYSKVGFVLTSKEIVINDVLTLVVMKRNRWSN